MPVEPHLSAPSAPVDTLELWLEPVAGGRRVRVPDDGAPFIIGRQRTAGLVIADPSCSREHASIRHEAGTVWLDPLSLRQPTLVNGTPHDRPMQLASGDLLRFGDIEVRVQLVPGRPSHGAPRLTPPPSWSPQRGQAGDTQLDEGDRTAPARLATSSISIRDTLVLGRKADQHENGVALNHPTVSIRHAVVRRAGDTLSVRDLSSTNGTFVNGARVQGAHVLHDGDVLRVGPFTFKVAGGTLVPDDGEEVAQLTAHGVVLEVSAEGTRKHLLRDVSIGIRSSEFVAIIGPSGCGKSTLIRILSGRALPTEGAVSWKATDLHRSFDALKGEIAFVPQRETLLEPLTVRQALTYTARLRLAADITADERQQIVEDVIATVGLQEQAELPISRLSGGQRKRAGLANELIVSPKLMFLDEVTSGLDEATDREMMKLFRKLADARIAVVCVTHTLANVVGTCDSLIVMARGGTVAYHGPLAGVLPHFEVDQLGDIYGALEQRPAAAWHERHVAASPYQGRVSHGPASAAGNASPSLGIAAAPRDRRAPLSQLWVLLERYLEVTFADRRTLAMAGVQSIVIAGFLRLVFGDDATAPPKEYLLVFLLGVSAFWFGCNNSAKEIVKERSLFHVERDVNLRIPSYLWSKIVVLGFIGVLQTALLFAAVRLTGLTFEHAGGILGVMVLTVLAGTTCGLFISAVAGSEDQAITIVPIALIPQLLLSGAVVSPLTHAANIVAKAGITASWTYRSQQDLLSASGSGGGSALWMLAAHVLGYALLTLMVLSWRERTRRH